MKIKDRRARCDLLALSIETRKTFIEEAVVRSRVHLSQLMSTSPAIIVLAAVTGVVLVSQRKRIGRLLPKLPELSRMLMSALAMRRAAEAAAQAEAAEQDMAATT